MYKAIKVAVSIFVTCVMLLSGMILPSHAGSIGENTVLAADAAGIKIGSYIQFGRYYNEPILWRVINVNNDGSLMLLSERILSLKPFDANGELSEKDSDSDRIDYGSNNWESSNLREWLNSDAEKVSYTYQPPDKAHINNGYNPYENEAGFLNNFTQAERNAIEPVTHKSILPSSDSKVNDGGKELYRFNSNIEQVVQNFDNAYYKNITDRVFLLDVKELHDYVFKRGYEHKRRPTKSAAAKSDYNITDDNYWYYWLRTPNTDNSFSPIFICYRGLVNFDGAFNGDHGVLPSLNLKSDVSTIGGDGSEGNPYIITGDDSSAHMAPNAYSVQITGDARIGNTVTGVYTYSDLNGDTESGSIYKWYISDTKDGEYTLIEGENSQSYTIKETDISKYVKFEVTPRTTVEPVEGQTVQSIPFKVYKSDNANLAYLKYNGKSIDGFNSNQTEYQVLLPEGTVQVPVISVQTQDSRAQVQVTNATVLPGTTVIRVTSEDNSTKTYTISFSVAQSYLESIHPYANDFDYTWSYSIPSSYSGIQAIFSQSTEVEEGYDYIYITDGNGAQIEGSPFTGTELKGKTVKVPGNTIKVRLKSDSDGNKYGFSVLDIKPDFSLKSIKVNGVDIDGFQSTKQVYRYVLPVTASEVPAITAEAETGAVVNIVPAATVPGNTEIEVLDDSGNLVKRYIVQFTHVGDIGVGDYIQFGRYYNEPIQWRVINQNNNGSLMLLAEKILSLKAFDGKADSVNESDQNRLKYGSNNWEKSSLREWLNNDTEKTNYTYTKPDKYHIYNGYNDYSNESGFLYNFTLTERDAIEPVNHKSILSSIDRTVNDGGKELYEWNSSIDNIVQNFDNAYYKNVIDKVFLLDTKELHDYVYLRGDEYKRKLTSAALDHSDYKPNTTEYWYYWLRTPSADNSYLQRFGFADENGYDFSYAYDGKIGVLPALNLKSGITTLAGDGSEGKPYVVGGVFITKAEAIKMAIDYINALPGVDSMTLSDKEKVQLAESMVDSAKCKGAVDTDITNLDKLVSCQSRIAELEKQSQLNYGDLNGDGKVTSTDCELIKKFLIGQIKDFPIENGKLQADVDGDGKITSTDYSYVEKFVKGKLTKFPKE